MHLQGSHSYGKWVYAAGLKSILVHTINTMLCFIFPIKTLPEASSPLPCSTSCKSCSLSCLQCYCCRGNDQPIPPNAHLYQETKPLLGGLTARSAGPLREPPEPRDTLRHIDPLRCGEDSQCMLGFRSLPTLQHTGRERQKLEEGTTETVGKRKGFYTSNFWSCSSSTVWASSINCLELPHRYIISLK